MGGRQGVGREVAIAVKKTVQRSSTVKTRTPEQSIWLVVRPSTETQPWPRVQSQVDVIHLVCSTGTIVSNPHLYTLLKAALKKADQSRMGIICTV